MEHKTFLCMGPFLYDTKCVLRAKLLLSGPTLQSYGSSVHGDSPGKNTGVGCHALLQWIFPTQGLKLHLLTSPALAGRFFTTGATWEAAL